MQPLKLAVWYTFYVGGIVGVDLLPQLCYYGKHVAMNGTRCHLMLTGFLQP